MGIFRERLFVDETWGLVAEGRVVGFVESKVVLDDFITISLLFHEFLHHGSELRNLSLILVHFCQDLRY